MCGIAGIVGPAPEREQLVLRMLARLEHRGPDEQGVAAMANATIGTRRLAIIDLEHGQQPMYNETGTIAAIQNGEIYNYQELREWLVARGHQLTTRNDTEVLPHLYEEDGPDFVKRLRGMFAVAVWDEVERRLVLARDRVGKKPLVYANDNGRFAFASELQALLALPGMGREIDDAAIGEYLAHGYVPAPRTAFARIRKLEPGSLLVLQDGAVETRPYWTLRFEPKSATTFAAAVTELGTVVDEAVRIRLMSDVPLGVLLSGGLDSSTVVAYAAPHVTGKLKTFSIGFGEKDFDELRYARLVAERFGTDHHEFVVAPPSAMDVLPTLVRHFGEPFADSSAIPTFHVAKLARTQVTVVLNGDGGDEAFGGYPRYRAVALGAGLDRIPGFGLAAHGVSRYVPRPLRRSRPVARVVRLAGALGADQDERYFRWMTYFAGSRAAMRSAAAGVDDSRREWNRIADRAGARDPVDRALAIDIGSYLPGDLLVKMDIATMANSVEGRSPFLDHRLLEFTAALPWSYKVGVGATKRLLRALMRDRLPAEIIRRRKMGFGVPVGEWLRGPMAGLIDDLVLAPDSLSRRYLRRESLERLVADHRAGIDHTPLIWSLVMLELWHEWQRDPDASSTDDPRRLWLATP